jgi:hypothetical protein
MISNKLSRDAGVPKDFSWIQTNSVDTLSADRVKGYELIALWRSDGAAWNSILTP